MAPSRAISAGSVTTRGPAASIRVRAPSSMSAFSRDRDNAPSSPDNTRSIRAPAMSGEIVTRIGTALVEVSVMTSRINLGPGAGKEK